MLICRKLFKQIVCFSSTYKNSRNSLCVGILGAPFKKGQSKDGVDTAPDALREFGLVKDLEGLGVNIKDFGNVQFEDVTDSSTTALQFPQAVGAACRKLASAVKEVLLENRICVTIGGDHSLGLGTVHGHSELSDICVLWVDAHPDINTPTTTYSGHMHGLPCSFFVKELQKYDCKLDGFEWVMPRVKKNNLAYIGLRSIDPFEKLILTKENILHFTMVEVDKLGIHEVIEQALKAINPSGKLSLHVSFDIDAICKLQAPSTGTPVVGGLTVREAFCIAEKISTLDNFKALDIMEINPRLGNQTDIRNTLEIATELIKAFLGCSTRSGNLPVNVTDIPIIQR